MRKEQVKEYIVDRIMNTVLDAVEINELGYFDNQLWTLDFNEFRKTVTSSGTMSTGKNESGKPIVLSAQDYQYQNEEFNNWLNLVSECYHENEGRNGYIIPQDDVNVTWDLLYTDWMAPDNEGYLPPEALDGWYDYKFIQVLYNTTYCQGTGATENYTFDLNQHVLTYLSQFVPLETTTPVIDPDLAEEILDTTIYELLPGVEGRQIRINNFFAEWEALKGEIPPFVDDVDDDQIADTWIDNYEGNQNLFHEESDISHPSNSTDGYITRLSRHENEQNTNQSLEWLREQIEQHLTDIDKTVQPDIEDERPEYENEVPGYLQIRGLNQSIIVRRQEGDDIGLIGSDPSNPVFLRDGFTIGMWVKFLDKTSGGTLFNFGAPLREENPFGFMLETFVIGKDQQYRAPDVGQSGTWGDLLEAPTASGGIGWPGVFFQDQNYERFVRLVVRENPTANNPRGNLRDSHTGASYNKEGFNTSRLCTALETDDLDNTCSNYQIPHIYDSMVGNPENEKIEGIANWVTQDYEPRKALTHTRIPYDKNEWYYIVANYNPNVNERVKTSSGDDCMMYGTQCTATGVNDLAFDSDYWHWNVAYGQGDGCNGIEPTEEMIAANPKLLYSNGGGSSGGSDPCGEGPQTNVNVGRYTDFSGEGAKCKVEIISRSDLLRAKGYKI